jgi:predicted DNA-binding protein|nr:MAG TPA: antitoxin [Caudoviricetes sp.]
MGKNRRLVIRVDDRTSMLLSELSDITGTNTSVIVRGMIMRCVEELIDKSGNWRINNEKNKDRKD